MDGPVGVLTMAHEPHNLVGPELLGGLLRGLRDAEASGARAVLLRSALRHFSAGADISLFLEGSDSLTVPGRQAGQAVAAPPEFLERVETFPLPIVCAIHGVCLGGGLELALACDYIVAGRSARLGCVEVTIGLHPIMGAVQRLVQRAGVPRAKGMAMLGRRYDPDTLCSWGVINAVVEDDDLDAAATAVASELAAGPTVAHAATKALAYVAGNSGVRAADLAMAEIQTPIWRSADLAEGLKSFLERGPGRARFDGR